MDGWMNCSLVTLPSEFWLNPSLSNTGWLVRLPRCHCILPVELLLPEKLSLTLTIGCTSTAEKQRSNPFHLMEAENTAHKISKV